MAGRVLCIFKFASLDVVSNQQCELVNCASENFSNVLDGSSTIGLAVYAAMTKSSTSLWEPTPTHFFIGVLFLGIVCSWLAICFWNDMSRRLTPALGGQMIIFETIFAVIYAHIMRQALPTTLMSVGMVLLLAGVFASVRVFHRTEIKAM